MKLVPTLALVAAITAAAPLAFADVPGTTTGGGSGGSGGSESDDSGCSVSAPNRAGAGAISIAAGLALVAGLGLRRRRS